MSPDVFGGVSALVLSLGARFGSPGVPIFAFSRFSGILVFEPFFMYVLYLLDDNELFNAV